MHAIRVDPKRIWPDRIPQADVPAAAVGEPQLGKDAKCPSHLLELPSLRGFFGFWERNVMQPLDLPGLVLGGVVQGVEVSRHRLRLCCRCRCGAHDGQQNLKKIKDHLRNQL